MDWLTFVARIIDALVWPATLLAIIYFLRKPISGLIPLLQRLKYKDFELEFGRQMQEVRDEVRAELPPGPAERPRPPVTESLAVKLASVSPRAAVLEAWRQVEDVLIRVAQRLKVQLLDRQSQSATLVLRALQKEGIVDPGKVGIFQDLRVLRNSAAHAPDFALTAESAIQYAEMASRLVEYLESL